MPKEHNGYTYSKERTSSVWQKTYYKCVAYKTVKCKARLLEMSDGTVKVTGEPHSCRQPGRDATVCYSDGASLLQDQPASDTNRPAEAPCHPSLYGWFQRDEKVFVHKGHKYVLVDSGEPALRPGVRHYACVNGHQCNSECPARLERVDDRDPTLTIPHSKNCGDRDSKDNVNADTRRDAIEESENDVKDQNLDSERELGLGEALGKGVKDYGERGSEIKRDVHTVSDIQAEDVCLNSNIQVRDVQTNRDLQAGDVRTNCDLQAGDVRTNSDIQAGDVQTNRDLQAGDVQTNRDLQAGDVHTNSDIQVGDVHTNSDIQAGDVRNKSDSQAGDVQTNSDIQAGDGYSNSDTEATENSDNDGGDTASDRKDKKKTSLETNLKTAVVFQDLERSVPKLSQPPQPLQTPQMQKTDPQTPPQMQETEIPDKQKTKSLQLPPEMQKTESPQMQNTASPRPCPQMQTTERPQMPPQIQKYESPQMPHPSLGRDGRANASGQNQTMPKLETLTTEIAQNIKTETEPESQYPQARETHTPQLAEAHETHTNRIPQAWKTETPQLPETGETSPPQQTPTRQAPTPQPPETGETPTSTTQPPETAETSTPQLQRPQLFETRENEPPQFSEERETQKRRAQTPQLPQSSMTSDNGADVLWLKNLGHRVSEIQNDRRRKRLKLDIDEMVLRAQREEFCDD